MNLGMSVRAELFRARRMKLAVIIALMYLGIAGIYVFAGSGAWVSAGGEGQFFGFSADPGYLFSIGVGPTGISSWLSVVSMAHTVFFPIVSVVVAGTLFGDATSVSARGVSIARGFRSWQLFAAKTLACEVYTLCPYIVFTLGVAAVFAVCSGSGLDSLTVGNVTSALLSNIVIDAAYTLMVAVAYEVFRIRSLVSGALLVATFAGLVIAMSFPTVLPPVHMAYWMRACGAAGGTVLMAACGHAVIVSLACLLLLSCSFYRRRQCAGVCAASEGRYGFDWKWRWCEVKLSQFNVVHEHNGSLLIMNARTGGILSLNPEYAQKFKRIQEGDVRDADDLVAELIRGGILVNEERDELGEIRLQSRAARFANTALSLTIAPTMACNFCCPYCYEKGQAYTTMGEEVLTQLSKFVKDYYPGIASLSVGWYGGEPLLGMKMIERITSDLKDVVGPTCEYSASIVTNGYLLTPDVARRLAACGVTSAQVTIDGSKSDHDSRRILHDGSPTYERILKNVKE